MIAGRNVNWLVGTCLLLMLVLSACAFPGVASTAAQLPPAPPLPAANSLPPIHFPQDEGAHNKLTEWWYYTGHLEATNADGKQHTYGFEVVIFQALRSNLPPVYPAHFAISDITRGQFHYDQRLVAQYSGTIPDGQSTQGIHVQVGNWSIQGLSGKDQLVASMPDYSLNLSLSGLKPATLHNGDGLITYGLNGSSYYYSRTRMAVSGTLLDHTKQLHVTGTAWMDHQWGDFLISNGGWDWYSLQLNNNTEIMLYVIRDPAGNVVSTYAGYIDASGHSSVIPASNLQLTALNTWTSQKTGITYPSGWHIVIHDPHLQADLTVQPLLKNQELVTTATTGNIYWEGAVGIQGQSNSHPVAGEGYIELTGYLKK